jgi:CDP-diacylglycerol---glycerol-3-phosphate 3-phosphatidyltransferase
MTLYGLKPAFQALLRPIAQRIFERGGTANLVTLAAAAGSLLIGLVLAALGPLWPVLFLLLPIWLIVRMAFNAIDGLLAREFGQQSRLGAYLNEICDVVSDAALMLPFAMVPPFTPALVVIVVVLAGLAELAGALGPSVGAGRRYDGPAGKSDRALAFGVLGLWLGLAGQLPGWTAWAMPLIAMLLVLTIVNRVRGGLAEAVDRHPSPAP